MPNLILNPRTLAILICACVFTGAAHSEGFPTDVEVLGEVTAVFDGSERQWLTFHSPADTAREAMATAYWSGFDTSVLPDQPGFDDLGVDPDTLSDEERAMIEMMQAQMAQIQSSVLDDLAAEVSITVQAHDPENPALLTEGVLILAPAGFNLTPEDWTDLLGQPVEADITYVEESTGGLPSVLYSSDARGDGELIFDVLSFDSPFGRATGRFSSTLCRVEMQGMQITEDPDDCRAIDGRFDTELMADGA
ncbi:MAG: hypothetical protein JJU09_00670 [Rhodobacteraceae bacterium]|nr:hypothetical protein [Paracoccaceae bacterium]